MELKNTCSSQIRNSVVKKFISSSLTMGLLFSSILPSFAGTLSEDGRYESFEGSNIAIDSILEEDKVNVEIEGNTLVNVLNDDHYVSGYNNYIDGVYTTEQKSSDSNIALNKKNISYKTGVVYTLIVDIKENTLANTDSGNVASIASSGLGEGAYVLDAGSDISIKHNETGVKKIKATTRDVSGPVFTHMLVHKNTSNPGGSIKFSWMLLEGDWTNKEIPKYFKGIKSAGEYEKGNHSIELKSQEKNVFSEVNHSGCKNIEITSDKVLTKKYNSKNISLNEPLRGLPNGVADKIVKKNGQWVIERNCGEVTFDGDENWIKTGVGCNDTITTFTYEYASGNQKSTQIWGSWQTKEAVSDKLNCIGDELYFNTVTNEGFAQGHLDTASTDRWYIGVLNSRLSSTEVSAFKQWLTQNPITIVYQLATPIYENLNIDSTVNLYLNTTYISNNSIVPASMKIVVDRTPNRAKEAIEIAKTNTTVENISQARCWTNLMKESILKDSFQAEVNNITDIKDLSIKKKVTTVNSDIYIKPKNMLSLSIDTNNIIFNDVDAIEDTEKLNAVNLSVISSLPYKINAYLEEEIYNNDKSEMLDKSVLNIKANVADAYKIFTDLSSPLTLLDNQDSGMNNSHIVDLKLVFNSVPKADVYNTVIKFEVEQK